VLTADVVVHEQAGLLLRANDRAAGVVSEPLEHDRA
jgi:hypothetical protein